MDWTQILTVLGSVLIAFVGYYFGRARRELPERETSLPAPTQQKSPPPQPDVADMPVPEPPPELLEGFKANECILVVGSGMTAQAGLETWSQMLHAIVLEATAGDNLTALQGLLEAGRVDEVVGALNSLLPEGELQTRIFARVARYQARDMGTYRLLASLPVAGVVSLNLDGLAAEAFADRFPNSFDASRSEECLDALSRNQFFVMMLNGTPQAPGQVLLTNQHLKDAVSRNDALRDLLGRLYYSRSLIFIGSSLSGVQGVLGAIARTASEARHRHYALVQVEDATWSPVAANLDRQYGVTVLPFSRHHQSRGIASFLGSLNAAVARRSGPTPTTSDAALKRVELKNIGPFDSCTLEIHPKWTVVLGDNGVGKSTVLRAIAVALTGRATDATAMRLLKSGATAGSIIVTIGGRVYETTIATRSGGGAFVSSRLGIPIEREAVLAVGFSALRTVGWRRDQTIRSNAGRPVAADLLPLTSEEPDPRLDGVKEWIFKVDGLRNSEDLSDAKRYGDLFGRIFSMFETLAAGVGLSNPRVNRMTGEITIDSGDGPIPFESLSQGTLSLVGWAGALMQRLHETAPEGSDAMRHPAIVLVDEIDAHMHPAWQQTLIKRLSEAFPNVQFVVTSHSPLLVGGLEPEQVYRFARESGTGVVISQPSYPLKGLGAAGLLTSGLFGLRSHLDPSTEQALDRKRRLTVKVLTRGLEQGEEEELKTLQTQLQEVDFSASVRDPLYHQFVKAMTAARAEPGVESAGQSLTPAEQQRVTSLAEEIAQELVNKDQGTQAVEAPTRDAGRGASAP